MALLASRCPQAAARAPLLGERPQLERDNADAREIIGFPVLGHRVGWLGSWEQNGSEVGAGCRVGGAEPWRTPRPRKTPAYARDSDRCDQEVGVWRGVEQGESTELWEDPRATLGKIMILLCIKGGIDRELMLTPAQVEPSRGSTPIVPGHRLRL